MKQKLLRRPWLSIGSLALATIGTVGVASGAVNFVTVNSATRSNTSGESFGVLSSSTTTFCFLVEAGSEETDSTSEFAECRIESAPSGNWVVVAALGLSSDADVYCNARCYTNN